jgi:sialic acid synthase SpsE
MEDILIGNRIISNEHEPFIIAEAGINHNGDFDKAIQLIDMAKEAGSDCVKFQYHIAEAELIKSDMRPGYLSIESLWDITKRVELSIEQNINLQNYCNDIGIIYLCTPFSKEAAIKLYEMNVPAFKIGSGECRNLPLLDFISKWGKPIILSTGMNTIESIRNAVSVIKKNKCQLALMHCTSIYPTPYDKVRLGALNELRNTFNVHVGLSDHSDGIYTCLGAVALGAVILEKHITVSKSWDGPDIAFSIDEVELRELVNGSKAVFAANGGIKGLLKEEIPVRDFSHASVVSTKEIKAGELLDESNIWVKKPGNGEIPAEMYYNIIGKKAVCNIKPNIQIQLNMLSKHE